MRKWASARRAVPLAGAGLIVVWTVLSFGWASEGNGWTFLYLGAAGFAGAVLDFLKLQRAGAAQRRARLAFAALFAAAGALAEYSLYSPGKGARGLAALAVLLLGGGAAAHYAAGAAARLLRRVRWHRASAHFARLRAARNAAQALRPHDAPPGAADVPRRPARPAAVFCASFLLCFAVFFLYYRLIAYPGYLSNDSLDQIGQIMTGEYVNHHPFYHTLLIGVFMRLAGAAGGAAAGGTAAASAVTNGVIFYMVFQIIVMSAIFAFAVMTLYEVGMSRGVVLAAAVYAALFPYHMDIISTLWKDILFAGCVLLVITAVYRFLRGIGRQRLNDALLFIGGLGYCLFRTNGFAAFVFAAALLAAAFLAAGRERTRRRLFVVLALVILTSWVLKKPVLKSLDVESDYVGALAMPLQMLSRTYLEGGELTADELDFLQQIVSTEDIEKLYDPNRASHLMQAVRKGAGAEFYRTHRAAFYKMWLAVGLRHPGSYIRAWVDETRGYWFPGAVGINSGIPARTLKKNDYGIHFMIPVSKEVKDGVYSYVASLYRIPALHVFADIGLHVWLVIGLFFACASRRRSTAVLPLFVFAVLATLWATTPIYNQFRYAYAVFTAMPFLAAVLGAELSEK